ncbi:hypothetical protein FHS43_002362 [Streptosporangium becharense]|uniref:DUF1440 domain-containing protein n=1 Tax=Streptosporangium becharense TaxID=1816182 RepID=A0A7W9MIC7_9ACTN|nr:DUF6789 family protein [Streptosporangium becharense]MBB2911097.1 hypothetical protein [Streptosporangium becharense]MBB5821845.1 hypothetical protein [Streptosporangium becharense]
MKRDLVKGAAGGAFATAVMSVVMLAGTRAGLMPDQPPKRIARAFLPGYKHRPKQGEGVLGAVTHFGFGSGCGALLALASGGRRVPVALGAAYGLAIWVVSYQGWVPGLGILPPISRDRPGRPAVMAAGHVVYGTMLALAVNRLRAAPQDGPGTGGGDPGERRPGAAETSVS